MTKSKYTVAILLPYKEIYSTKFSGAASIWVKDYLKKSSLKTKTLIYGYLDKNLKPLTPNFRNLLIKKTIFSKSKSYAKNFLNECKNKEFDIIEIQTVNVNPTTTHVFLQQKLAIITEHVSRPILMRILYSIVGTIYNHAMTGRQHIIAA